MKIKEAVETLYSYGVEYEDINEATDTLLTAYEKQQKEIERLQRRIDYIQSLEDCNEKFEL